MGMISKFDPELNFWDANPAFKIKSPFRELMNSDKSKNKSNSSQMMWFIAFCYDLGEGNIFRNLANHEKHSVVGKEFIGEERYFKKNEKQLTLLIEAYKEISYTPAQKHLRLWEELLEKRSQFLKDAEYTLVNFSELDKMAVGTEKLFKTFAVIQKDLAKEDDEKGAAKGDKELSLSDLGEI